MVDTAKKTKRSRVRISPKPAKKASAAKKASVKEMVAETVAKTKKTATAIPKKPKAERKFHENVTLTYAGPSKVFNRLAGGDAKTPIRVRVSKKYSERVVSLVADMAEEYGGKPWSRLNVGAGALGRALFFGCVAYVDGADNITEDDDGKVYHGRNARFKIVNPKSPHKPANEKLANLR